MKTITAIALVAGLATAASADVITSWVNFGQTGDQASSAVGTQAANVTGVALTRGSGLNPSAAGNSFSSSGWDQGDGDDANDYFSFGFTVADGFSVNLESFWVGARSSNTGPGFLGLFSSVDGFSTNLFTFTQSGTAFNNAIADVSALSGLTGTVEFRVLALNNISANGGTVGSGGTFRFGDHFDGTNFTEMRFEGTVVPAPGAMALLGLGGLVATRRRR
jgi:MYXO-CTERM domain-containing protein